MILSLTLFFPAQTIENESFTVIPEVQQYQSPLVIEQIKKPEPRQVTLCNCWQYVKNTYYSNLPSMNVINSNIRSEIGDVAVMYYPESGLYHYAKVISSDGYNFVTDEANYNHCKRSNRQLTVDYPRLLGFYHIQ